MRRHDEQKGVGQRPFSMPSNRSGCAGRPIVYIGANALIRSKAYTYSWTLDGIEYVRVGIHGRRDRQLV